MVLVANFAADIIYMFVDPRVRVSLFSTVCLFAIFGPLLSNYGLSEYIGPRATADMASPSGQNPFGLTINGYDVFTRVVYGLRSTIIVGLVIWPWTARAVRSQTLSIKNEEHVNLSRITSNNIFRILFEDIAANILSYIFMVFIQQFLGTIMATFGL